jgi:hypothetical protein
VAVDVQIDVLSHAQHAMEFMEERFANKLRADTDDVDHLIHRKHLLTDRRSENDKDIAALDKRTTELEAASAKKMSAGKNSDAKALDAEVAELREAADSLRGTKDEVQDVETEITAATADGKIMDGKVNLLSKQRGAIEKQVKLLQRYGEDLDEASESAGGFGVSTDDDPYLKEAQAAMERASGWSSDHLDTTVTEARDMLTNGISGKAGKPSAASNGFSNLSSASLATWDWGYKFHLSGRGHKSDLAFLAFFIPPLEKLLSI